MHFLSIPTILAIVFVVWFTDEPEMEVSDR